MGCIAGQRILLLCRLEIRFEWRSFSSSSETPSESIPVLHESSSKRVRWKELQAIYNSLNGSGGVNFVDPALTQNLPYGRTVNPQFVASYSAGSAPPATSNGVDAADELVGIAVKLQDSQSWTTTTEAMNNGVDASWLASPVHRHVRVQRLLRERCHRSGGGKPRGVDTLDGDSLRRDVEAVVFLSVLKKLKNWHKILWQVDANRQFRRNYLQV